MRMPGAEGGSSVMPGMRRWRRVSQGRVCPVPRTQIFEAGQLLDPDRAAGMELAGGDADLAAEAELAAIGELGRGVVDQDGASRSR